MVFQACRSLLLLTAFVLGQTQAATQFHLSLAGDGTSDYFLDWVTPKVANETAPASQVYVGSSPSTMTRAIAGVLNGEVEEEPGQYVNCWTARLTDLTPNSVVFYSLNESAPSNPGQGPVFGPMPGPTESVRLFVPKSASADLTWSVWADLGSLIQGGTAGVALPALEQAALHDKSFDAIFNLGDLSYELTQTNGKDYMDRLEPITSAVPMHVTTGNHEYEHALAPEYTLRNYNRRFAGQFAGMGKASGSGSNEFFSFDSGLIHFSMLNTELYGNDLYVKQDDKGEWKEYDDTEREKDSKKMAEWFEKDLKQVDRQKTPYVVVTSHRCPFKAPKGLDKKSNRYGDEIVPLLAKYKVDLLLCAHTHLYLVLKESEWKGNRIPPTIVSGAPGNADGLDVLEDLKLGDFKVEFSAKAFGYGLLKATEKQLEWKWGSTGGLDAKPTNWTEVHQYSIPRAFN
ncbi:hypothetical protein Poli38472_008782 [Pythium oligandrum]|uniref:Purple acid phosphatase n=1 Tax=Pythium oligandrum TaxID=41045 RepID=A0A8K1C475_PYTOL|nr:hypothetical protein Poli38472_008782 [Pythium oligandrum]|eukprot:TMW56134.1 hypothetical protein Poli38472_008782 [Pythium oligandrum]